MLCLRIALFARESVPTVHGLFTRDVARFVDCCPGPFEHDILGRTVCAGGSSGVASPSEVGGVGNWQSPRRSGRRGPGG